jgi:CheY-like chemotaxis protein
VKEDFGTSKARKEVQNSMRNGRKVLVVDDDADWRDAMVWCLSELGYRATVASSGEEALKRLSAERFSVMLLDLRMPGMDGEQVAARLPPGSPHIVFLTGAPMDEAGRALRKGAHYYLPKGASIDELSLLLDSLAA